MLPSSYEIAAYAVSSPAIRNSLGIATAAHTARYFSGPLAGFVTLSSLVSAAFYTDSRPYVSLIGAISFYYGPKALEVTIQKTVAEAGVWLLKTGAKATVFVAVEGGKALYNLRTRSQSTATAQTEIPVASQKANLKKENDALKKQVRKLKQTVDLQQGTNRRVTRSMTRTLHA